MITRNVRTASSTSFLTSAGRFASSKIVINTAAKMGTMVSNILLGIFMCFPAVIFFHTPITRDTALKYQSDLFRMSKDVNIKLQNIY
ncbi:hypothetical protein JCM39068_43730 [Desulfocastanea catecholica]